MERRVYLTLEHDLDDLQEEYRVFVTEAEKETPVAFNLTVRRASPLYAICSQPTLPTSDTFSILFLVHKKPFAQLDTLTSKYQPFMWISLGLAALVIIVPEGQFMQEIVATFVQNELICTETWDVRHGVL